MSNITEQIPIQNFEIIRDRIVEILQDELTNQFVNESDLSLKNIKVYSERSIDFDKTELPAISVDFDAMNLDSTEPEDPQNELIFNIIVNTNAKSSVGIRGDEKAKKEAQKLIGMCRYILQSPYNYRLRFDFGNSIVRYVQVTVLQAIQAQAADDGLHTSAAYLTLKVGSYENNGALVPFASTGTDTNDGNTKLTVNN